MTNTKGTKGKEGKVELEKRENQAVVAPGL
jgi:hypothetical protein